ncbi:MAG TPA: precorrin-3B C(17)-methyltransferase [Candidatus Methanomethylophilaceae archaeon]|nr:precorrin-3B C(17)-methyltransferase [Candidatus Methanomethylophilaceae archaeon]
MKGKLTIVGFGPGSKEDMTLRAVKAIETADIVTGYTTYIDILRAYFPDKHFKSTGMMREVDRCRSAIGDASLGKNVAIVSSGDSGIYGMAGIIYQLVDEMKADIDVEVVPGVTAASAAGSILGAPLMHDLAIISLSDLMTPLDLIMKRVEAAGQSDLIVCIYNPRSKGRPDYLSQAADILLKHRSADTPVGIVRNASREGQEKIITTLGKIDYDLVDMFSTVIVGNSQTYTSKGMMITPRGYKV